MAVERRCGSKRYSKMMTLMLRERIVVQITVPRQMWLYNSPCH